MWNQDIETLRLNLEADIKRLRHEEIDRALQTCCTDRDLTTQIRTLEKVLESLPLSTVYDFGQVTVKE